VGIINMHVELTGSGSGCSPASDLSTDQTRRELRECEKRQPKLEAGVLATLLENKIAAPVDLIVCESD
jgi:hypothetical protein